MKNFTPSEVSMFIYVLARRQAKKSAEELIKFGISNDELEKLKLEFDLSITFISISSFNIYNIYTKPKLNDNLKEIITNGVYDLYFGDLDSQKNDQDPLKNTIDAGFFIREKDEIDLFCRQLPQDAKVDRNNLHCRTFITDIARILFNKRLLEYKEYWLSDMQKALTKKSNETFIPQMPHKVYEHYSGKSGNDSETLESLMFITSLFGHLVAFSYSLTHQLLEINIT